MGGRTNCADVDKVKVELANGKGRTIQHMSANSFWSPDGKPISAATVGRAEIPQRERRGSRTRHAG